MKKLFITAIAILFFAQLFAQNNNASATDTSYNFDFEKVLPGKEHPYKWIRFNKGKGYKCETSTEKHGGSRSLLIERVDSTGSDPFASMADIIPAKYEGNEIEFRAYLKMEDVKNFAAILIRIDNADYKTVQFKTLEYQKIHGTKDWQLYNIKAPIPVDAHRIYIAAILGGAGKLWIDDAQVLIDGKDISEAKINPDYNPNPKRGPVYGSNPAAAGWVKLKDTELYYETYGSGEPLLLLHGNSQMIYAFNYQIGELAKYYKVIAVDTRGQGKSTDMTTGQLSYDLFANDMKQLLDSLHIKKANILGWSDGGNTGLIMAIKYPGYVHKLAIMGANLFPTTNAVPDTVWNEVRKGIAEYQKATDAHSKEEVRLFTMLLNEPHLTFDDIKKIQVPVLVMAGEHDLILEKHTRAIASAIPKSKLVIFKGATHYAPVEIPKEFNKKVLQFMNE
jgi:pimeloyl-ACP methyl ester carboxylesterase